MTSVAGLLSNLLDYVVEQSKETNPAAYKLEGSKDFIRYRPSLSGLPGIEFDKSVAGDHVWMVSLR